MPSLISLRPWAANRRHPRLRYSILTLDHCLQTLHAQPAPHPPPGEISLAFLTDAALAQLHADFLDDPAPTDVITFPGDPVAGLAGEICISVDRAAQEARRRSRRFAGELTLYMVHGWLHLAGFNDHTSADRRAMRGAERRMLAALAAAKALPDFRLTAAKKYFTPKNAKDE